MDSRPRSVPAPRKDLSKLKRKRPSSAHRTAAATTSTASMDIESFIAALNDEAAMMELPPLPSTPQPPPPPPPPLPQVHYYTISEPSRSPSPQPPEERDSGWEPRLLIRQVYKLAGEACAVVGLECAKGYNQAMYLVNSHSAVSFTCEDLINLRSTTITTSLDQHLSGTVTAAPFKAYYFKSIIIEPTGDNSITISNYHINVRGRAIPCWNILVPIGSECDIVKSSASIRLHRNAWESLKKHFDCIESYLNICRECSSAVDQLVWRYTRFFNNHYKAEAFRSCRDADEKTNPSCELQRHISIDLPIFLRELNERRLPPDTKHFWCKSTPMRPPLLTWLDSEVRRYCGPNIFDSVIECLKSCTEW